MTSSLSPPHTRQKLAHIQALRGIAALLVVGHHLELQEPKFTSTPILPDIFNFGMAGVDLFFVISGFIMVYVTASWDHGSVQKSLSFLKARILRIYPLYWIISAALFGLYLIWPEMVFSSRSEAPHIFKSFLLWPNTTEPLLLVGWTLIHEMGFYLVFALLLLGAAKFRVAGLIIWALIILAANYTGLNKLGPITAIIFHPLSLEFIAGAIIGWIYMKRDIFNLRLLYGLVFAGLAFCIWQYIGSTQELFFTDWSRVLYLTLPLSFLVLVMALRDKLNINCPTPLTKLGDWSYSLYLTHVLSISLIGHLWTALKLPDIPWLLLCVMAIACIIVAAISYYVIENPLLRLSKKLRQ